MWQRSFALLSLLGVFSVGLVAQGLNTNASRDDWEEINFEFNSAILTDGYPSLLRIGDLLQRNPSYRVRIEGHADRVGSNPYNDRLGTRRADEVKRFLVKYGAKDAQIQTASQGKRTPKVPNTSKEGRFMNRRVVLTLTDGNGKVITQGGANDVIRAMDNTGRGTMANCCDDVLKKLDRLDEIVGLLKDYQTQNANLRDQLNKLNDDMTKLRAQVENLPKPLTREQTTEIVTTETPRVLESFRDKRFSLLNLNAGVDDNRNLTFTAAGRYFAPFKDHFAIQAQGEYMYWRTRREGQFDLGLVNRISNFQAGLFTSFKHVTLRGPSVLSPALSGVIQSDTPRDLGSGTLGQAALTLDILFPRGRAGFFGTKGFMDGGVLSRDPLSTNRNVLGLANAAGTVVSSNVFTERYLSIVDQYGLSATVGLLGDTYLEGNFGLLRTQHSSNRPGGTLRLVVPFASRLAFTLEGGLNETLLETKNYTRLVAGIQLGNFIRPKDYTAQSTPVPTQVPRVRYEVLTRTVRNGNSPPVAVIGPDQTGVAAGTITLNGSGSYDPDGDAITYQWTQISGPSVSISGANTATATFTADAGQTYSFRLTVRDTQGAQGTAQTTISTARPLQVQIVRFAANPPLIQPGQTSVISYQVLNATSVEISGVGQVNPQAGTVNVNPTQTTTYTIIARNATSEARDQLTITVQTPAPIIAAFTANPSQIQSGQSSTLTWSTQNATRVTISGIGDVELSGSRSVSPTQTTTYTLTASNASGQVTASTTVTVITTPAGRPTVVTFSANPPTINQGQSSTLTWTTQNADRVTISGVGSVAQNGNVAVSPAQTTTYTLTATNAAGDTTAQTTVTVVVPVPAPTIVSFTANPTTITAGQSSTLTWTTQNATRVTISGIGDVEANGSRQVSPPQTTTYTLTAFNATGQVTATATITVNPATPQVRIISFTASPNPSPAQGTAVTLTWVTENATRGVTITPDVGQQVANGTAVVRPTQDTTYTLTALGDNNQQATATVTVRVTQTPPPIPVIAGPAVIETFLRQIELDASGSSDPSGLPLTFTWTPIGNNSAVLDQGQPRTRIQIGGAEGDKIFQLTVTNSRGVSASTTVTVRFRSVTIP